MKASQASALVAIVAASFCLISRVVWAESGVLVLHVEDEQRHPVAGLQIGVEGDGGSATTKDDGKARIALAKATKTNRWVSLQILKRLAGKDYVMVSPWDYRVLVPSFENESENFVKVVVVQRGSRAALENGTVLAALAAKINKAKTPKLDDISTPTSRDTSSAVCQASGTEKACSVSLNDGFTISDQLSTQVSQAAVARQYGLQPEELDRAIRAWGATAKDTYDAGLAALYEGSYDKATANLNESLKQREEKLSADQKAVADAAFFLGASLNAQGRYKESALAYQRSLQLNPDDSLTLNNAGVTLTLAGEYADAEPLLRRALKIRQQQLGANDPEVAKSLMHLATLLKREGRYSEAESSYRRSLSIYEQESSPDLVSMAKCLNNFGVLLRIEGRYFEAAQLYRKALDIRERLLGPNDPDLARSLNNLGTLLLLLSDTPDAEQLLFRALAIEERAGRMGHPDTAVTLRNLAGVAASEHDYDRAWMLVESAIAIDEKVLEPDHLDLASCFNAEGSILQDMKDYPRAESSYLHALKIRQDRLGTSHLDVAEILNNLGSLYADKGDSNLAEYFYHRALAISEALFGPDHPTSILVQNNLRAVLQKSAQTSTPKMQE